jgi:hypothetical protein
MCGFDRCERAAWATALLLGNKAQVKANVTCLKEISGASGVPPLKAGMPF